MIEMDTITLPKAEVKVEFSLTATVNITRTIAQRRVSRFMLDNVGNLLYGEKPTLAMGEELLWRVPIWLALPSSGPVGKVGSLDVNAQTGEILYSQKVLEEIEQRADVLATPYIPEATP